MNALMHVLSADHFKSSKVGAVSNPPYFDSGNGQQKIHTFVEIMVDSLKIMDYIKVR